MADVFISYGSADKALAERLCERITECGVSVWFDRDIDGGSDFSDAIEEELNRARKVIVLWSRSSVRSRWVRDEATAALEQGKMVPVMVDGTPPPMGFRQTQAIALDAWVSQPNMPLPARLERALGLMPGEAPPADAVSPPARRKAWLAAAAIAGLLLLSGGAWLALAPGTGSETAPRKASEIVPVLVRGITVPGGKPEDAALAAGVTNELVVRLRSIDGLRIATALPDGSAPSDAFAHVNVVEGSIQRSGDNLRTTMRLLDRDGTVRWAQIFDRPLVELLEVQQSIASAIAGALSVSLDVGANSRAYGGTDNPEAYAAYMLYWAHEIDFDQSVPQRYLERAVALDPNFGKAISALALLNGTRIVFAETDAEAARLLAEMDAATERALAANPDRWFGQIARAWYLLTRLDFVGGDRQMRRVVALDPGNDPEVRLYRANNAMAMGRLTESMALRASRTLIDPVYANDPWKVADLLMTGQYDEAIDEFQRLSRIGTGNLEGFAYYAYFAYLLAGREAEAAKFAKSGNYPFDIALDPALPSMTPAQLRKWASQPGRGSQLALTSTAISAAYLGHDRLALALLRLAYQRPGIGVLLFIWHPALARLRKTDAFEQFVTDLGLVAAWRDSGDWGDFCRPLSEQEISCV